MLKHFTEKNLRRLPTLTPATLVPGGFTLGLDLGDRSHYVCVLDATGQIIREASLPNTRPALAQLLVDFPRATVALAAGMHSAWISRYLTGLGATVIVANPRKLAVLLLSLWKHGPDYEPRVPTAPALVMPPAWRRCRRKASALTSWAPCTFWKNPDPSMDRPHGRVRMAA